MMAVGSSCCHWEVCLNKIENIFAMPFASNFDIGYMFFIDFFFLMSDGNNSIVNQQTFEVISG